MKISLSNGELLDTQISTCKDIKTFLDYKTLTEQVEFLEGLLNGIRNESKSTINRLESIINDKQY